MYGETSFELINQMIDQISPIIPDNKFLDLGSGVGQVQYTIKKYTIYILRFAIYNLQLPHRKILKEMDHVNK